jgi:hypothetical protein
MTEFDDSHDEETGPDVAWLIGQAREFYLKHPGEQIPPRVWYDLCEQVDFDYHYDRTAKIGQNYLQGLEDKIIPAIAAISLGVPTEQLAKTLEHHEVPADFFLRCFFSNDQVDGSEETPDEATHERLSPWNITKEMVNAIALIPSMRKELARDMLDNVEDYGQNYNLEMACILSDEKCLWPLTQLKTLLLSRGDHYEPDETQSIKITSILAFKGFSGLDALSNEQILNLLERSGNLHIDVNSENGFDDGIMTNGFLREMFAGMLDENDCRNFSRMIEAINSVDEPGQLAKLNAKLIASIAEYDYPMLFDRVQVMKHMERHLDHQRYAPTLQSMLLKLNVLPVGIADKLRDDSLISILIPSFQEFDDHSDQVFKRLHAEIKDLSPAEFRKPHFRAISEVINQWKKPQDLSGIDLQGLLHTTLAGMERYQATTHYDAKGYITERHKELAVAAVNDLAGFFTNHCDVDYKRFSDDLPSSAQKFLAANGFEIKKLRGINRRDKGDLLTEGMGL